MTGSGESYFLQILLSFKIQNRLIGPTPSHTHSAKVDKGRQQLPPLNKTTSGLISYTRKHLPHSVAFILSLYTVLRSAVDCEILLNTVRVRHVENSRTIIPSFAANKIQSCYISQC